MRAFIRVIAVKTHIYVDGKDEKEAIMNHQWLLLITELLVFIPLAIFKVFSDKKCNLQKVGKNVLVNFGESSTHQSLNPDLSHQSLIKMFLYSSHFPATSGLRWN